MIDQKPIRILHVVGAMNRGGTETMLMNIYRKIDHEYVQFDFISYSQEEAHYDWEIKQLGGRVIHLTKTNSIKQIYQAIQRHGPFIAIHAHTLFHSGLAVVAAKWAKVPVRISHAHTTADHSDSLYRKVYMKLMQTFIHKYSTDLLACSQAAGLCLFGKHGVKKQTYTYFPNVIDYQSFLNISDQAIDQLNSSLKLKEELVLGHVGTFKEVKNHSFLLEMMRSMNDQSSIKLVLVGDGELKETMIQKAKDYKIEDKIYFLGTREDIQTILNRIDLFILPSLVEGLGLVLLEAQASGTHCLVSEAIQPEADLGLGLMTTKKLSDGPQDWANQVVHLTPQKERDQKKIIKHFKQNGYDIELGIAKMMDIYEYCRRDKDETSTHCVL